MNLQDYKSQAENAYAKKQYKLAAELFSKAALKAEESSDPEQNAELRNNASVAYLQGNDPEAAYQIVVNSESVFIEIGDKKRHAMALGNQAAALEALGEKNKAKNLYIEAGDLLKSSGDNELRSFILKRISALQVQEGKQFEALGSMFEALNNAENLSFREKTLKKLSTIVMQLMRRG
jgi:tetratricopeptide (TPR) repeat protein